MNNDIKQKKRLAAKRPRVWQDIVINKPPVEAKPNPKTPEPTFKSKFKFNLKLPKIPKFKKIKLTRKSMAVIVIVALSIISLTVYGFARSQNSSTINTNGKDNTPYKTTKLETGTPKYQTITPDKQDVTWTKISPPESDTAIYAYADKITDVPISVTEQPLPDDFKTETSYKIEKLAKSYDANTKLSADDISIYVGTSVRDSVQSVILVKNNLLIMIKSKNIISDQEWVNYVNSLE